MAVQKKEGNCLGPIENVEAVNVLEDISKYFACDAAILTACDVAWDFFPIYNTCGPIGEVFVGPINNNHTE